METDRPRIIQKKNVHSPQIKVTTTGYIIPPPPAPHRSSSQIFHYYRPPSGPKKEKTQSIDTTIPSTALPNNCPTQSRSRVNQLPVRQRGRISRSESMKGKPVQKGKEKQKQKQILTPEMQGPNKNKTKEPPRQGKRRRRD